MVLFSKVRFPLWKCQVVILFINLQIRSNIMKRAGNMSDVKGIEFIIDNIMYLPLFKTLKGVELDIVAKHLHFLEAEGGTVLFSEGDLGDYICFVIDGTIEIIKESKTGENVKIASLSRGMSIGEMSVIDNSPRSATAIVRGESSFLVLKKQGFDAILSDYPEIGIKIFRELSRLLSLNLRKTSSRLADYMLPIT